MSTTPPIEPLVSNITIDTDAVDYAALETDPDSQDGLRIRRVFIDGQLRMRRVYEAERVELIRQRDEALRYAQHDDDCTYGEPMPTGNEYLENEECSCGLLKFKATLDK